MKLRELCIKDVMKTQVDIFDGMKTVQEALVEMRHIETKTLIVDKRTPDDEWGIVVIADIARLVLTKNLPPERTNIYEIMSKPALTVNKDMKIRHCARLFNRFNLSRAPVVENGEIIGIVSFTDMIMKGLEKQNEDE